MGGTVRTVLYPVSYCTVLYYYHAPRFIPPRPPSQNIRGSVCVIKCLYWRRLRRRYNDDEIHFDTTGIRYPFYDRGRNYDFQYIFEIVGDLSWGHLGHIIRYAFERTGTGTECHGILRYGKIYEYSLFVFVCFLLKSTAGPGSDDPEHDESTPAETKIVTIVLPSCIILRL